MPMVVLYFSLRRELELKCKLKSDDYHHRAAAEEEEEEMEICATRDPDLEGSDFKVLNRKEANGFQRKLDVIRTVRLK